MSHHDRGRSRVAHKARDLVFQTQCFDDLRHWVRVEPAIAGRLLEVVADIRRNPFYGIGKPEALKHEFRGHWARRITAEHRLIYRITDTAIRLVSGRYHY